jgi:hypothetical protein
MARHITPRQVSRLLLKVKNEFRLRVNERRSLPSGRLSGVPLTADEPTVIALLSSGPFPDS